MNLACCIWALSGSDEDILTQMANLGFQWIDVQPFTVVTPAARQRLSDLNLQVSCVGISFGLPEGATLDSADADALAQARHHLLEALTYSAEMGAQVAYVVPGLDNRDVALERYAQSLTLAADKATDLGIKVGLEHFPGRALPTASGALDFLAQIGHANLYLLFDIGHVQLSQEDPAEIIRLAGSRLGYVHLDDNDGQGDLHWSLLDGVMTEDSLSRTFEALGEVGYEEAVSLELSPTLANPVDALQKSKGIVMPYFSTGG